MLSGSPQSIERRLDAELHLTTHPQFVYAVSSGGTVAGGHGGVEH